MGRHATAGHVPLGHHTPWWLAVAGGGNVKTAGTTDHSPAQRPLSLRRRRHLPPARSALFVVDVAAAASRRLSVVSTNRKRLAGAVEEAHLVAEDQSPKAQIAAVVVKYVAEVRSSSQVLESSDAMQPWETLMPVQHCRL